MELTENERLMLVNLKEEIRQLTTEILELADDPENAVELKKRITSVLSKLTTIASFSKKKVNLYFLRYYADSIFDLMDCEWGALIKGDLGSFCNYVNSIGFDFTKTGINIHLPKIDISIFRTK